ncbi:MAG TPA: YbdD/YjiX family protein [Gemmatimonadaceae bacterium]|nr:YbdD/YjiX family protein [Gemmatimonadaceae bacterium]
MARAFARATQALRRVVGAPDYETYLAHSRAHHPGAPVMSRQDFFEARLAQRYEKPGSRCC